MAYTEEIFQKIQKQKQQCEMWMQEHKEELQIIFTTRFQIAYGEHDVCKTLTKYKEAMREANKDADDYMDENGFNKKDSTGRTSVKIALRSGMFENN